MSQAVYVADGDTLDYTPVAAVSAGDVVQVAGKAGIVVCDAEAGETVAVQIRGIVAVTKPSATVFAAGADVEWDNETDVAVADTLGDFSIGKCVYAAGSGESVAYVLLNG